MKEYLSAMINEQVNRALALKKMIPYPLRFPEIMGLAERCRGTLDNLVTSLHALHDELQDGGDERDIFRDFKDLVREVSSIEYYGIPALYYQTDEVGFLNKIMFRIHQEIRLPFPNPCICCTSNEYYYSFPPTNTVFLPLGESEFLLHMPDLYHELGHYVIANMESELRLNGVKEGYKAAVSRINDHYINVLRAKTRDGAPQQLLFTIERIFSNWEPWLQEFFCDLFAVYTVGPAYAWSHLHLTTKMSKDIYELTIPFKQTHPSDDARMKIVLTALNMIGFGDDALQIKTKWDELTRYSGQPSALYPQAYPDALLTDISTIFLQSLKNSGFTIVSPNLLKPSPSTPIGILLNEAWKKFWAVPYDQFRKWEEEQLQSLRNDASGKVAVGTKIEN